MKRLLLLFAAILMASTGLWAETQNVSYLYPVYNTDGVPTSGIKEWKTASVEATIVEDDDTPVTWGTAGTETWYVVTGTNVTLSKGVICAGNVHLILADGAKLTATGYGDDDEYMSYAGIQVSGVGNSLTIYGQTAQTGQLEANGGDGAAGIGGKMKDAGSNITINGGIVTTTGGAKAAGIGGGDGGSGFNVTINRGIVTANGNSGAGIGGGNAANGSNITINGGAVTANGNSGAGIGGGNAANGSNITINGGMIIATSYWGAGIGNGDGASTSASNIKVATKCIVKSVGEIFGKISTEVIATDRSDETDIAGDLAGKSYVTIESISTISTTYIDENGEVQEVVATEARSSATPVTWGIPLARELDTPTTTWYIVNEGTVLLKGAICQGDVRLILADGAKLTATGWVGEKEHPEDPEEEYNPCYPGIQVSGNGNSLTIYGQANQSGQLEANGGEWAAGIGGGFWIEGTNITINGGTVTANGGEKAAGIGGGNAANGSNITINGGTVTANGGYSAAGIGGGDCASGSNITINGGTVTATGGIAASGIGGDNSGSSNNIRVATTLLVKADGNNPPTEEIEHDNGGDIGGKLHIKRYATITSILPFRDAAFAAINAAVGDVTNENIMYFITPSKKNIEAATTTNAINTIKEKALADLQNIFAIYDAGKTAGFGTLSEKQNGPALIVTDKDDKEIILYSPKSVEYIKVKEN